MNFQELKSQIIACHRCPRLVKHRESVPIRCSCKSPWRKPVPGFGDKKASLLIIGLAPSVEGANRTGRIFTGDASAKFLMENLYAAGLANQPNSESVNDGLKLMDCYLTAVVKCVPPHHKPLPGEIEHCHSYLEEEIRLLKNLKSVLVLGQIAMSVYKQHLKRSGLDVRKIRFAHGACYEWDDSRTLFISYHPSPQNTNTGVLTKQRFQTLLKKCRNKYTQRD